MSSYYRESCCISKRAVRHRPRSQSRRLCNDRGSTLRMEFRWPTHQPRARWWNCPRFERSNFGSAEHRCSLAETQLGPESPPEEEQRTPSPVVSSRPWSWLHCWGNTNNFPFAFRRGMNDRSRADSLEPAGRPKHRTRPSSHKVAMLGTHPVNQTEGTPFRPGVVTKGGLEKDLGLQTPDAPLVPLSF
jgi:hypothetical protein